MYLSIIILIGTIVLLFGYIKFHIDLKLFPDERKWYEKIRFLFPMLVIPIFGGIYYFWNIYPETLNDRDSQIVSKETGIQLAWTIEGLLSPQSSTEDMSKFEEIGTKYGAFGDSYGSLNTLFTGFAFSGLIISIFIQLLELRQTRKELYGQKTALLGQQEESKKQTQILQNQQKIIDGQFKEAQKQNFINEFYFLLDQRNFLLSNIILSNENEKITGINVLSMYANEFGILRKKYDKSIDNHEFFDNHWYKYTRSIFNRIDYQLIHYFESYELIIETIYKSESISDSEKKLFINKFKTYITTDERLILMWLGIFEVSIEEICNNHALLHGIHNTELEDIGYRFYKQSAFGNSEKWNNVFKKNEKMDYSA